LREKLRPTILARGINVPTSDPTSDVVDVSTAIGHLPAIKAGEYFAGIPNHRARTLSETNVMRISAAKPGESNAYLAGTVFGDLSLACHRRVQEKLKTKCFTDVYTRMRHDRPSPTITTKCHSISNGRFGHYDTSQNRGISLREAAALQSFTDDYVFEPIDGVETIARMIGNAVPPRLANYFASHAVSLLDQRRFRRAMG
jgi:DNA (cytosine-5)-methyltransferase 1